MVVPYRAEESLSACYAGLRLSYAVLFHRYFVNGKKWLASDYVDFLQTMDIAYAKIVVTERGLAESIRQGLKRLELRGPEFVFDLSWLPCPSVG